MSENEPKPGGGKRRPKRFLSPSQKYEIWLQLIRQEVTVADVASAQPWPCARSHSTSVGGRVPRRVDAATKAGGVRLHQGIGYACPDDEHEGRGEAIRRAREAGLEQARLRRLARHRAERENTTNQGSADVV